MLIELNLCLMFLSSYQTLNDDVTELKHLEDKNKELERDVIRWQERCRIAKEVSHKTSALRMNASFTTSSRSNC